MTAPINRWSALEFAAVCEAVAKELRDWDRRGAMAPDERLALYEWWPLVTDVIHRTASSDSAGSAVAEEPRAGGTALRGPVSRAPSVGRLQLVGALRRGPR